MKSPFKDRWFYLSKFDIYKVLKYFLYEIALRNWKLENCFFLSALLILLMALQTMLLRVRLSTWANEWTKIYEDFKLNFWSIFRSISTHRTSHRHWEIFWLASSVYLTCE